MPVSTTISVPVMDLASSEARKTLARTTSQVSPMRPGRTRASRWRIIASVEPKIAVTLPVWISGRFISPGRIELQRMPLRSSFRAMSRERRAVAAIEAGGAGAVALDGRMIDKPGEAAARRMLAHAQGGGGA